MLDVALIRNNPDVVRAGLAKRGIDNALVDGFLKLDEAWRSSRSALDGLRAQLNAFSKERAVEKAKEVKAAIKAREAEAMRLERERAVVLDQFPNMPAPDAPEGKDESENVVLRVAGKKPQFSFEPKDYLSLGEKLDIIDVKKAAMVSGARFGYLKGQAALLEMALTRFAFTRLTAKGFIPVLPPVMIRPEVYKSIGRLTDTQKDERYYIEKDDIYLVGTSEHTIVPLHMNEILSVKDMPKRYVGFSTCFRREAGSYGKDTKGILRVHQFDKVEMISFCAPEDSEKEHQFLLACQEELMRELGLPYQVVQICTGDMGWTDYKQYDIETWIPSEERYRETQSCSNTTDFQTRGMNCKYAGGGFAHALNATAIAMQRMIIAIIENNQQADGTFIVPEALKPYMV